MENYIEILKIFYEDGLAKLTELASSLQSQDLNLYTIHVLALKSAGANIGAEAFSQKAEYLETAARNGDVSYVSKHHSKFIVDLKQLLVDIGGQMTYDF